MKPKVLVLMATYNGEKYISDQIKSILNQNGVEIFLKIADDCSNDGTLNIIKKYAKNNRNISYYINKKNKGFTYNFIDLIFSNCGGFDYYALSDQDDVWNENKIINAISMIKRNTNRNGCLYCSNLTLVDENLNFISMLEDLSVLKSKRYSYLVNNVATGCTIVFDKKFYYHILKHYPHNIYLHDYWLLLIAVYTADWVYDINSYILYRQHSKNIIGSNKNLFKKIKKFYFKKNKTSFLVREFFEKYNSDIYYQDYDKVYLAAYYSDNLKNKFKLLFSNKIKKRKFNIIFKIKVLLNKY